MTPYPNLSPTFADIPKVTGYEATPTGLADSLKGAEIVLIPAGVPRKPGMTRDGTERQCHRLLHG
jgi:malate/lactate dehydrogenase